MYINVNIAFEKYKANCNRQTVYMVNTYFKLTKHADYLYLAYRIYM